MRYVVSFPLEVMYQMEYGNTNTSKAFEDFYDKFKIEKSNEFIQVGYPDELISSEFINKLYANLSLTEEDGLYKMHEELRSYRDLLKQEGNDSTVLENLSENAKETFTICVKRHFYNSFSKEQYPCGIMKNVTLFNIRDTLYPMFHPDRPYFVNLAFLNYKATDYKFDLQNHYLKYVDKFGRDQNLPAVLMTNLQMVYLISYQTRCYSLDAPYFPKPKANVFNC